MKAFRALKRPEGDIPLREDLWNISYSRSLFPVKAIKIVKVFWVLMLWIAKLLKNPIKGHIFIELK